jgi:hypothetical protein
MMDRPPFFVVAAGLIIFLSACAHPYETSPTELGSDASRLLATLKDHNNELENFRGIGKLRIRGQGKGQTNRIVWIGSRPQRLRVEVLGAWAEPTLTFLVKGSTFYVYAYEDNRCFKGKATADNMLRLVSIPLEADVIYSLLSGQPPLKPFHHAKAQPLREEGEWLLRLYTKWRRIVEKIQLKDDGETVEHVEVFDRWGKRKYTVDSSQFEDVEGLRIPHKMILSHAQGLVLSLKVDRFWSKASIPAGAFTLELCDADVVDLDS